MTVFNLPDLGEGLPDAEIVKWWVKEGDEVEVDQIIGEITTAKATVEFPSPYKGRIVKFHGGPGDIIETGQPLITFALEGEDAGEADVEPADAADPPEEKAKTNGEIPASTSAPAGVEVFRLPDLGEGLQEAEIIQWLVAEGEKLELDQNMVEVSTDKAVVEIPAPFAGTVVKLHGAAGDIVATGAPLIEIASEGSAAPEIVPVEPVEPVEEDRGTVVGKISVSDRIVAETSTSKGGVTANAAVRALARKLKVELNAVPGSGADGAITLADIRTAATAAPAEKEPAVAAAGAVKIGPAARATAQALGLDVAAISATGPKGVVTKEDVLGAARILTSGAGPAIAAGKGVRAVPRVRVHAQRSGVDIATISPSGFLGSVTIADVDRAIQGGATAAAPRAIVPLQAYRRPERGREVTGQPERVVGPRRVMAQLMAKSHAEVVATTIFDEADVTGWPEGSDITMRIVRAIVAACFVEPALNAWFDGAALEKTHHREVHLGVAVDAASGLFVPVLRDVDTRAPEDVRADLDRLRERISDQKITAREMRGATITLSNYGMIAGRFATPVISPPEVAIVGIGGLFHQLALTERGIKNHRLMPVSLTFDHRACTGGDTARFLAALLQDLSLNH